MQGQDAGQVLAETAAAPGTGAERAGALLEVLRRVVPFDGAWLALTDPLEHRYHSLAHLDVDTAVVDFLAGPLMARDIEATGAHRRQPPVSPSDLPYPAQDLRAWAECLVPAGIHEALALGLFTPAGRHVGFLALLSGSRQPPAPAARRELARVSGVLAHGIDPMRSVLVAARLVRGARAGVVLSAGGGCEELPGLPGDALLAPGSAVVAAARTCLRDGQVCSSFLWPLGGAHASDGHVRVTVLAAPDDVPLRPRSVALLSPAADLHGLTPRELQVLGLVVEGCSNQQIARALVVTPRTVATHVEHILVKLGVPTRTLAAVRAERDGLYVPPLPGCGCLLEPTVR